MNNAYENANAESDAAEEPKEETEAEPEANEENAEGKAVKGSGEGYGGDVNVEVVFSEDGEIKSLKIDEDDFSETDGIGSRVLDDEKFLPSFIGKKAPVKIEDVEAVSGASITSQAVLDAVNNAFNNR